MGLLTRALRPAARGLVVALFTAIALTSRPAHAADEARNKARQLADQGKAALARKDYAAAADLFGRAAALVSAPTLELGRARAEVGLGHLLLARELYTKITNKPAPPGSPSAFVKAVSEAVEELEALERRLPSVRIAVHGPAAAQAEVTLDGEKLTAAELEGPRFLDPGPHVARATAPEHRPAEMTFTATEGEVAKVQLDLAEEPFSPRRRRTMLSAALIGLGAGALGFSGAAGGLALRDRGKLFSSCGAKGLCSERERPLIDAYHRASLLAWPAVATGALAAGAGAALFFSSEHDGALLPIKLGPALLGAGIAGLSFGAASGFVSLGKHPDRELGAVAVGSLAVGGVAAISGTLLVLLTGQDKGPSSAARSPRPRWASAAPAPSFVPYLGPGGAGLLGSF